MITERNQFLFGIAIPFLIPTDLRRPKVSAGGGQLGTPASFMSMPETAVNKDCSAVFGQYDVR